MIQSAGALLIRQLVILKGAIKKQLIFFLIHDFDIAFGSSTKAFYYKACLLNLKSGPSVWDWNLASYHW